MNSPTIEKICEHLGRGNPVRERWGEHGRLVIEKQLPYLCLYRFQGQPDEQFVQLVRTQPSYLIAENTAAVQELLHCLAETISSRLNAFMLLEMWPGHANSRTFKVFCPQGKAPATVRALEEGLAPFTTGADPLKLTVDTDAVGSPPGLSPVADTLEEGLQIGFLPVALEMPPLYRKTPTGVPADAYFRGIKVTVSDAVKKAAFEFMRVQTPYKFNHHLMLGKTKINPAAIEIDQHLADLTERIDFLLRVSPINTERQWQAFQKKDAQEEPQFSYRLITLDPEAEKRKLYQLKMSEVGDPALSFILREKRLELDKQLTMLEERGSDNFKYLSQSLYPVPGQKLVKTARQILRELDQKKRPSAKDLDCFGFAKLAEKELKIFRKKFPDIDLQVEIRPDVGSLMVSRNRLFISRSIRLSSRRAEALIQHEVGTHMLTFCNGKNQVLRQLATGLAGYDDLQEGLAVLAEYLVGGLTADRLRILAARVLAVDAVVKGQGFVEVFRLLTKECNLSARRSFYITSRVLRGGGLTKDAIYLDGLLRLLSYLQEGGDLSVLYAGKFSFRHIPLVQELLRREVLKTPLLPSFFDHENFQERLNRVRLELPVTDLVNND